jgi:hypothetical protein
MRVAFAGSTRHRSIVRSIDDDDAVVSTSSRDCRDWAR